MVTPISLSAFVTNYRYAAPMVERVDRRKTLMRGGSSGLTLAIALALPGCAPQVRLAVAPEVLSADWAVTGATGPEDALAGQALDWAAFGSPQLDALLDRARRANADIAIASARIRQAMAELRLAKAGNGPVLGLSARGESNARGGAGDSAFRDSYAAGDYSLSYTLDLSGQLKATRRAAFARYRAAGYEAQAIELAMEAAVAGAYVEYAALGDRIRIAEESLSRARELERRIRLRAEEGVASELDAGRQTTEANALAASLSRLHEARARTRNALGVLVGEEAPLFSPAEFGLGQFALPRFRVAQPAELITRRPDMRAADALIEAANGDVARARAAFIPDVEISAGSFIDSAAGGGILNPGFALASRLFATIFDNGRMKSQVYRASAQQEEAVARYRKALLEALAGVQDALAASVRTAERVALLDQSQKTAMRSAALARVRYAEGDDDLGTLLDSERRRLEVEDSLAIARQESLDAAIALYLALGGAPRR